MIKNSLLKFKTQFEIKGFSNAKKKFINPLVLATRSLKTESEFFAKFSNICHSMPKLREPKYLIFFPYQIKIERISSVQSVLRRRL